MGTIHFGDMHGNNTLWGHLWEQYTLGASMGTYTLGTSMGTIHFGDIYGNNTLWGISMGTIHFGRNKQLNLGLFWGHKRVFWGTTLLALLTKPRIIVCLDSF
jgi:hypothetical protein